MHNALALVRTAFNGWLRDNIQQYAAALAYYAVFSLAPLLLIAIGMAGVVLGQEEARQNVLDQAAAVVGPAGARAVETLMGTRSSAQRAGTISAVTGLVALLIAAVGVLSQLRAALNAVWQVAPGADLSWGAWGRAYVFNVALVIATGFLLLVSLVATATLSAVSAAARQWLPGPDGVWFVIDGLAGLAMTAGVFTLMFKVVPDAHVRWRDAAVGAAVTAVLFTGGRLALGLYLGRGGNDSPYEAAGAILALLAWVYYSAQLVLAGAEFTYAYAARTAPQPATHGHRDSRGLAAGA